MSADDLYAAVAAHAAAFRAAVGERPVWTGRTVREAAADFDCALPDEGLAAADVVERLVAAAEPSLMATVGPRFFGFVVGGALPSATAADMLTAAWDQMSFNAVSSPAAAGAEVVAGGWVKELLGLPAGASVGFVTGAQSANIVGLAAARHHVLAEVGWDVEQRGLAGAPPVRVLVGEERHATLDYAVRLLGLGSDSLVLVPSRHDGSMDVAGLRPALAAGSGPTVMALQSGNVNTGACDDLRAATLAAREHGAWVHVDGAFGLWAGASPSYRHLVDGIELADSWGCDGHKWLNLPYDSAFAVVSRPAVHAAAMSMTAAYLVGAGAGSGVGPGMSDLTPEASRRARGFAVWAGLLELGRDGVAAVVDRCCALARRFADGLSDAGFDIANDVVLNQVLVGFGDDERTDRVVEAVQRDGTCWMGGTTWHGRRLMRISVSNHTTTEADVDRSVDAIVRLARIL